MNKTPTSFDFLKGIGIWFLTAGMLLFAAGRTSAQTPAPTPPFEGPPIANAPNPVAYLITLTNGADEAEKKRLAANPKESAPIDYFTSRVVQWQIVRSGTITFVETTAKNGRTGEMWMFGGIEVVREPGGTDYFVNRPLPLNDPFHLDFGRHGFPFTAWVGMSNYDQRCRSTANWCSISAPNLRRKLTLERRATTPAPEPPG